MNAGLKLGITALLMIAAAAVPGFVFPPLLLAASFLVGALLGKIPPSSLIRALKPVLPVTALLIIYRLIFSWGEDASPVLLSFGLISVTVNEIKGAIGVLLRLFAMLSLLSLYPAVTPLRETLAALKKALMFLEKRGFPARDVSLALGIALRFVPLLTAEAEQIVASRLSRGADMKGPAKIAAAMSMIAPLFLRSLERAQVLARAMLLRLYH
jgi:energy-coupling factor transporter transmembrane protein EcfT